MAVPNFRAVHAELGTFSVLAPRKVKDETIIGSVEPEPFMCTAEA